MSLSYISVWDTALEKGASVFMEALPHTPPHPTPWGLGNLGGFSILHSKVFPGRVSNYPIQPISKTNNFKWGAYVCRGWGWGLGSSLEMGGEQRWEGSDSVYLVDQA